MPIYAYRCEACGHAKDVLQKVSDPLLTTCPACGAEAFKKQVTAAGFQLKGSGWYVTDFRGGSNAPAANGESAAAPAAGGDTAGAGKPEAAPAAAPGPAASPAPTAPAPAPSAPAPAGPPKAG